MIDTTTPPLDYADPAVGAWLHARPEISDGLAIVDYLADEPNVHDAAREYGVDCALGELASTDADLAWRYVTQVRTDDRDLLDRAEERLGEYDTSYIESLDHHVCAMARALFELRGEDEVYRAVDLLWQALDAGVLRARREVAS